MWSPRASRRSPRRACCGSSAATRCKATCTAGRCRSRKWRRSSEPLDSLLEARDDEVVEGAVEHRLRVALFDAGAQVLDARLVEHVRADLVAPADVGLRVLELLVLGLTLAHLQLVELRLQHREGFGAVAVLRAVV